VSRPPRRILVLRTSALGDVVHCLPVLTALARHLPEARVGWVIEGAFAPLLAGHPDLDTLIEVRLRAWRRRPFAASTRRELAGLWRALRSFRPDVVLDLMGNHKAGVLGALTFARRRIGLARRQRREPSSVIWITETAEAAGRHAVERALAVLGRLGLPEEPPDFGGDRLFGGGAAVAPEGPREQPLCLMHPGAAWGNKIYPPERWGAVARGLAERAGAQVRVALSPSPAERELAERIVRASEGAASSVDAGDLPTLGALSRRASLVLGGDSGPLHLAHALGTPVLCLMGPTDPQRHGPYGDPRGALSRRLPCSYCYRRFAGTKACLLELTPGAVVERAVEILVNSAAID
jgi:heptosyltransferase-1